MGGIYTPGVLLALALSACWRPTPWTPPPPPDEAVEALGEPAAEDEAEAEGAQEADAADAADAPDEEEDEAPAPPPLERLARPWNARVVQAPATLVDDGGQTLVVIPDEDVVVEVRAEQPHRLLVWCAACKPPSEGWIQVPLVARAE